MSFAVVELKYVKKKTFIVPICWIKSYKANHPPTQEFYCFISTDLKDDPNFESKYLLKFNGTSGLFKVFVLTVTDSLIDAVSYQEKKRIKSVPPKFRQPSNTDAELNAEKAKRKKKKIVISKLASENAKTKNMAHLANFMNLTSPSATVAIAASTNDSKITQQNCDLENGIENPPIQLRSPTTINFASIVREALETLENSDGVYNYNFTESDVSRLDEYLHEEPINTKAIYIENTQPIYIETLSSTSISDSNNIHQQQYYNSFTETPVPTPCTSPLKPNNSIPQRTGEISTETPTPTPCPPSTSILPQQLNNDKENTIPNQVNEISYKDAYLQLKKRNSELEERNISLQNALVAADKALAKSKVPEVPFTKQDGGRYYSEGVFLSATQCKILDGAIDHNKYVNNLALAIFGRETLKNSSVTGTASKKGVAPAKPPLNPLWLQLLYDLTDARTNKSFSKSDINIILNKKISNFNGADKRKLDKIARDARDKVVTKGSDDTRNGPSG